MTAPTENGRFMMGQHAEAIEHLDKRLERVEGKLDLVIQHVYTAEGRRRGVAAVLGAFVGAITGAFSGFVTHWLLRGGTG